MRAEPIQSSPQELDLRLPETVPSGELRSRLSPELTAIFAVAIFLASVAAMMPLRHYFDDETINVSLLRTKSLAGLYQFAQSSDVHPPLGYLANGIAYHLFGSLTSIFWANAVLEALAIFYFVGHVARLAASTASRACLAVLVGINPSLLLWGVSLRWYSYWIPLALALFTLLFLAPRRSSTLPLATALAALSFYFGYLTIVYVAALIAVEWLLHGFRFSRRFMVASLGGLLLIAPQCYYFVTVHMPQSKGQSSHNLVKLLGSAGIGALVGPLAFPIQAVSVLFAISLVAVIGFLVYQGLVAEPRASVIARLRSLDPLFLVAFLLIGLEILSGIAIKERNLVVANVLLLAWVPVHFRVLPRLFRIGFVLLTAFFLATCLHNGITDTNTGKASFNMPVAELRRQILTDEGRFNAADPQTWLVTWNDVDTCYGLLWGMRSVSPFDLGVEHEADPRHYVIPKGAPVVLLETQQGLWVGPNWSIAQEIVRKVTGSITETRSANLGFDRFHGFESKMTSAIFPTYQIRYIAGIATRPIELSWTPTQVPEN